MSRLERWGYGADAAFARASAGAFRLSADRMTKAEPLSVWIVYVPLVNEVSPTLKLNGMFAESGSLCAWALAAMARAIASGQKMLRNVLFVRFIWGLLLRRRC